MYEDWLMDDTGIPYFETAIPTLTQWNSYASMVNPARLSSAPPYDLFNLLANRYGNITYSGLGSGIQYPATSTLSIYPDMSRLDYNAATIPNITHSTLGDAKSLRDIANIIRSDFGATAWNWSSYWGDPNILLNRNALLELALALGYSLFPSATGVINYYHIDHVGPQYVFSGGYNHIHYANLDGIDSNVTRQILYFTPRTWYADARYYLYFICPLTVGGCNYYSGPHQIDVYGINQDLSLLSASAAYAASGSSLIGNITCRNTTDVNGEDGSFLFLDITSALAADGATPYSLMLKLNSESAGSGVEPSGYLIHAFPTENPYYYGE